METKQINKMSFIVVALVTIFLSTEPGLALPKSSPDVLIRKAEGFMREKDYTKALATVKKLLANYSDHPGTLECIDSIGHIYRGIKNAKAIELYQYFLSNYPSHSWAIEAQSGLAKYYIQVKDDTKAQAAVKKLLANYSDHPDIAKVIYDVANRYRKDGSQDRAIEWYEYIVSKHPSHDMAGQAQSGLAKYYIQKKDYTKAQAAVEKLMANYPDHPETVGVTYDLAKRYRMTKKSKAIAIAKAIELYQFIISKHPSRKKAGQALSDLARCYIWEKDYTKALAAVEKLKANYPDHSEVVEAINDLARYYIKDEDYTKALAAVEELQANYPDHSDTVTITHDLAKIYRRMGNTKAIELYEYIVSKHPSHKRAMVSQLLIAEIHVKNWDKAKTRAAVEKFLSDYSNHQDIANNALTIIHVAEYYSLQMVDKTKAIELFECVLRSKSSGRLLMRAQLGIAECYMRQMEYSKALAALEKLLEDHSDQPGIIGAINSFRSDRAYNKDYVDQKYVFDNWIDNGKTLQIQKIGLLFSIEYYDDKTTLDAFNRVVPKLAKDPDSLNIVREIADRCHKYQKDEIAIKIYQIYLNDYAIEADKEKIKLELLDFMYLIGTDPEKILISLEEYVVRNKATDVELTTKAIALRGRIFANIGEVDKAISEFLLIKKKYPETKESLEAIYFVGYCYMLQGKFDEAKESFNQVVKDYPKSSYADKSRLYLTRIEDMTG